MRTRHFRPVKVLKEYCMFLTTSQAVGQGGVMNSRDMSGDVSGDGWEATSCVKDSSLRSI